MRARASRDHNRRNIIFPYAVFFRNFCESSPLAWCAHLCRFFIVSCLKFSAVFISFFFGFGPGCQWHFNGKILKWWNRGKEREKNSERKIKFYDANEIRARSTQSHRRNLWSAVLGMPMLKHHVSNGTFGGFLSSCQLIISSLDCKFIGTNPKARKRCSLLENRNTQQVRVLGISFLLSRVKWPVNWTPHTSSQGRRQPYSAAKSFWHFYESHLQMQLTANGRKCSRNHHLGTRGSASVWLSGRMNSFQIETAQPRYMAAIAMQ